MMTLLTVVAWLSCGLLGAAVVYAYDQLLFPNMPMPGACWFLSAWIVLSGPIGLAGAVLSVGYHALTER